MSGYDLIANTAGAFISAVIVRVRTGRWGDVD
jgi:VanZ family protein